MSVWSHPQEVADFFVLLDNNYVQQNGGGAATAAAAPTKASERATPSAQEVILDSLKNIIVEELSPSELKQFAKRIKGIVAQQTHPFVQVSEKRAAFMRTTVNKNVHEQKKFNSLQRLVCKNDLTPVDVMSKLSIGVFAAMVTDATSTNPALAVKLLNLLWSTVSTLDIAYFFDTIHSPNMVQETIDNVFAFTYGMMMEPGVPQDMRMRAIAATLELILTEGSLKDLLGFVVTLMNIKEKLKESGVAELTVSSSLNRLSNYIQNQAHASGNSGKMLYYAGDAFTFENDTVIARENAPVAMTRFSNNVAPKQNTYFEVKILDAGKGPICIGLVTKEHGNSHQVGTDKWGFGYMNNGKKYKHADTNPPASDYAEFYSTGDVIGCLVKGEKDPYQIIFMKNGNPLGEAFTVEEKWFNAHSLFPAVSCGEGSQKLQLRFCAPFDFVRPEITGVPAYIADSLPTTPFPISSDPQTPIPIDHVISILVRQCQRMSRIVLSKEASHLLTVKKSKTINAPLARHVDPQTFQYLHTCISKFSDATDVDADTKLNSILSVLYLLKIHIVALVQHSIKPQEVGFCNGNNGYDIQIRELLMKYIEDSSFPPLLSDTQKNLVRQECLQILTEGVDVFFASEQFTLLSSLLVEKKQGALSPFKQNFLDLILQKLSSYSEYYRYKQLVEDSNTKIIQELISTSIIDSLADIEIKKQQSPTVALGNQLTVAQPQLKMLKMYQDTLVKAEAGFPLIRYTVTVINQTRSLLDIISERGAFGKQDIGVKLAVVEASKGSILALLPSLLGCYVGYKWPSQTIIFSEEFQSLNVNLMQLLTSVYHFYWHIDPLEELSPEKRVSFQWLNDICHVITHVLLQVIQQYLKVSLTEEETKHQALLQSSKLFRQGLEQTPRSAAVATFIDDFIEGRNQAQVLDQRVRTAIGEGQRGRLTISQQVVLKHKGLDRAIRAVIAAILHHMGLVDEALELSLQVDDDKRKEIPKNFQQIWQSVARMRRWFIGQHQGGDEDDDDDREDRSYDQLAEMVEKKALVLMKFVAAVPSVKPAQLESKTSDTDDNHDAERQHLKSQVDKLHSQISPQQTPKPESRQDAELQHLRHSLDQLAHSNSHEQWSVIPNEIIAFIQNTTDKNLAEELFQIIEHRTGRLARRQRAYDLLEILGNTVRVAHILQDFFYSQVAETLQVVSELQQAQKGESISYYTDYLEGCSPAEIESVSKRFFSVLDVAFQEISRQGKSVAPRLLECFSHRFSEDRDFAFLCERQVLSGLWKLCKPTSIPQPQSEDDPLVVLLTSDVVKTSWDLFQMIGMLALQAPSVGQGGEASRLVNEMMSLLASNLQQMVDATIFTDLDLQVLVFLHSISSLPIQSFLPPFIGQHLAALFHKVSSQTSKMHVELSHIILRLLRRLLPNQTPHTMMASGKENRVAIIGYITNVIGSYIIEQTKFKPEAPSKEKEPFVDECVDIIRTLMGKKCSNWHQYMSDRVTASLTVIPKYLQQGISAESLTPDQLEHVHLVIAWLYAMGEKTSVPGIGKKVETETGRGTITSAESDTYDIVLDSTPHGAELTLKADKFTLVPTSLDPSAFPLTPELLSPLIELIRSDTASLKLVLYEKLKIQTMKALSVCLQFPPILKVFHAAGGVSALVELSMQENKIRDRLPYLEGKISTFSEALNQFKAIHTIAQEMNNELGFPLSVCMEALSVSIDKNGAVDWVLERQEQGISSTILPSTHITLPADKAQPAKFQFSLTNYTEMDSSTIVGSLKYDVSTVQSLDQMYGLVVQDLKHLSILFARKALLYVLTQYKLLPGLIGSSPSSTVSYDQLIQFVRLSYEVKGDNSTLQSLLQSLIMTDVSLVPGLVQAAQSFAKEGPEPRIDEIEATFESVHPYAKDAKITGDAWFKGANQLVIIFDKIETDSDDYLYIRHTTNKGKKQVSKYKGEDKPTNLIIASDRFSYELAVKKGGWGYRFRVFGVGEVKQDVGVALSCWLLNMLTSTPIPAPSPAGLPLPLSTSTTLPHLKLICSTPLYDSLVNSIDVVYQNSTRFAIVHTLIKLLSNYSHFGEKPNVSKLDYLAEIVEAQEKLETKVTKPFVISKELSALNDLLVLTKEIKAQKSSFEHSEASEVFWGSHFLPGDAPQQKLRGSGEWQVSDTAIWTCFERKMVTFEKQNRMVLTEPIQLGDEWTIVALLQLPLPETGPAIPHFLTLAAGTNGDRIGLFVSGTVTNVCTFEAATRSFHPIDYDLAKLGKGFHLVRITGSQGSTSLSVDNIPVTCQPARYQTKCNIAYIGNNVDCTEPFNCPLVQLHIYSKEAKPASILFAKETACRGSFTLKNQSGDFLWESKAKPHINKDKRYLPVVPKAGFPTFYAQVFFLSGKWYYEVEVTTGSMGQVGWANLECECSSTGGKGIGDDPNGWSYDGGRVKKWHGGQSSDYGREWKAGDIVGCMLDIDNQVVSFSLNGESLGVAFDKLDIQKGIYPAGTISTTKPDNEVILRLRADVQQYRPEGYLPVDTRIVDTSALVAAVEAPWMIQVGKVRRLMKYFLGKGPAEDLVAPILAGQKPENVRKYTSVRWEGVVDSQLGALVSMIAEKKAVDLSELKEIQIEMGEPEKVLFPYLESIPVDALRIRFSLMKLLNQLIQEVFAYTDLSANDDNEDSFIGLYHRIKHLVFPSGKLKWFHTILKKSEGSGVTAKRINLDRMQAIRATTTQAHASNDGRDSLFGQLFTAMNNSEPKQFRIAEQAFKVKFKDEEGTDMGGPFRDTLTRCCEELQSDVLPLFILCPNGRNNFGNNRDKYILNPNANSQFQLALLKFLGKILGHCIRSKQNLELNFNSVFWKSLTGEKLDITDLEAMDLFQSQFLDEMQSIPTKEGVTQENFTELFDYNFTTTLSDGSTMELRPNGKDIPVNFQDISEYVSLILDARLNESRAQLAAVREGVNTVIPVALLKLFSWKQLEFLVVGTANFNVEALKKNVKYETYSATDNVVVYLWRVLESFTSTEKAMFVKFIWGHSRLPDPSKGRKFTIQKLSRTKPDESLPQAATCFLQLKLPQYTSEQILREKLLYAIASCHVIDLQ